MTRILVVGGYGAFGALAVQRLARYADLEIIVAGRNPEAAKAAVDRLSGTARARLSVARIDAEAPDLEALRALRPVVIVNTSGPFQGQSYALAEAAIAIGAHYIDLADARAFVVGIDQLAAAARAAGVLVVSGASTVPALSSAVIDQLQDEFAEISAVEWGVTPGNAYDPGLATTASILSYVGKPFATRIGGQTETVYGWQGLCRRQVPGLGRRWFAYCDIPDLELFPKRYPRIATFRFLAGTEVGLFHVGLWAMSWLVRWRLVATLEPLARPLLTAKRWLGWLGTDRGGMIVTIDGTAKDGRPRRMIWSVVAIDGHGPYIPTTAAVILARRLARGEETARGAMACMGYVPLAAFETELADLAITFRREG